MAKRVETILVDDIDGSIGAETVVFGLDGVSYEIDLSEEHAGALRENLQKWAGYARRTGGRKSRSAASTVRNTSSEQLAAIRTWANDNGYKVSDRGRVSAQIREAYEKAHA
jgi:hypothetical protein